VALMDGDDMVQQVAPPGFNPSLRDPVLPGIPEGSSNRPNSHRTHGDPDLQPILGVPIKNQKSGCQLIAESLSQLLHDPEGGGCGVTLNHRKWCRSWSMTKKHDCPHLGH
jgi:hypothetical protein